MPSGQLTKFKNSILGAFTPASFNTSIAIIALPPVASIGSTSTTYDHLALINLTANNNKVAPQSTGRTCRSAMSSGNLL